MAIALIEEYLAGMPGETVFFWVPIDGMPEEMVARNVQTVCTKVAPLLV